MEQMAGQSLLKMTHLGNWGNYKVLSVCILKTEFFSLLFFGIDFHFTVPY